MPEPLLGFGLPRDTVLQHHLQHNHFPPVNVGWVPIANAAIDAAISAVEGCDPDTGAIHSIDSTALNVVIHDNGSQRFTVRQVMDGLHLWDFVIGAVAEQAGADEGEPEPKAGE